MIVFSEKNILVLIMAWMKLMLKSLKMMVLIIVGSGNKFCFRWTYRIMMMLSMILMVWNSVICYLLSVNVIIIFVLISFLVLNSIVFLSHFILCAFFIVVWISILDYFCYICILFASCTASWASSNINVRIVLHLL